MLADRRAMLEGSRLPWREALEFEYRQGRAVMEVAARGAARFAGGEGRQERSRAARNCTGMSPLISKGSRDSSPDSHSERSIE